MSTIDPDILDAAVAAARQGKGGITRIITSQYFTFYFEGDEVLLTDEMRLEVEARLGCKLKEKVFKGLEGETALVPSRR
ncbi:hypothetical protein [Marivita sp.]|jgi:hypothetical protein|uniref:hypothetical protein n=1 Tax=Marivita sp. TaxID=2003365 RepID=UPI00321B5C22